MLSNASMKSFRKPKSDECFKEGGIVRNSNNAASFLFRYVLRPVLWVCRISGLNTASVLDRSDGRRGNIGPGRTKTTAPISYT